MALEASLSLKMKIVMIQEPFITSQKINHSRFNFYWLSKETKEIRVIIVMKKNLENKIIVDLRTNLIYHLYFILLEICELDPQSKMLGQKTCDVNI